MKGYKNLYPLFYFHTTVHAVLCEDSAAEAASPRDCPGEAGQPPQGDEEGTNATGSAR